VARSAARPRGVRLWDRSYRNRTPAPAFALCGRRFGEARPRGRRTPYVDRQSDLAIQRLTAHSARARWRRWWLQAERLAGLKHEARFGWHSLRHAFAAALRSQPDVDLAALGGWTSTVTLKLCYLHPELARMRQALQHLPMESTNGEQTSELAM